MKAEEIIMESQIIKSATSEKHIHNKPMNIIDFVAREDQQFLTSMVNLREEFDVMSAIQYMFEASMSKQTVHVSRLTIFQLLSLVHYHLLFGAACFMRCHMAEAFNSARVAIDASLIAAQIIADRPSQEAYRSRTHPFDKLLRYYKNLIKAKKPLPHANVEYLMNMHDFCSQFSSHADVTTFSHRLNYYKLPNELMTVSYFQFPDDLNEIKFNFLKLLHLYLVSLEVFANFIVDEHKGMPPIWRGDIGKLKARIEEKMGSLKPSAE